MFFASKLLSFATQPLAWVVFLLLAGLVCMPVRRQWGMRLGWTALTVLLLQGWEPLPDALLRQLETQHPGPAPGTSLQKYAGVVLLGGALEPAYVWQGHDQVALNDAAERMTVPVALLQQYPHLRLLTAPKFSSTAWASRRNGWRMSRLRTPLMKMPFSVPPCRA